ncbi:hypothetical protein [Propionibacterium australiense]|uniref:hypothetical protein n=1 Tax=Propionibacterium australiense TaxID=119981 RepID=UPI000F8421E4|nr:hypothetical protein [Propionibacterium australiense]
MSPRTLAAEREAQNPRPTGAHEWHPGEVQRTAAPAHGDGELAPSSGIAREGIRPREQTAERPAAPA